MNLKWPLVLLMCLGTSISDARDPLFRPTDTYESLVREFLSAQAVVQYAHIRNINELEVARVPERTELDILVVKIGELRDPRGVEFLINLSHQTKEFFKRHNKHLVLPGVIRQALERTGGKEALEHLKSYERECEGWLNSVTGP